MAQGQVDNIDLIYTQYREILNPLILGYEAIKGEFPVEIFNEIRSIFTHFAKARKSDISDEDKALHIKKAGNHLKRAILDGFKYTCMAYQDRIKEFYKEYKSVISLIDNGDFANQFHAQQVTAESLLIKAKLIENDSDNVEESYAAYEDAYNAYMNLNRLINQKKESTNRMSAIVATNQRKKYKISIIVNIVMSVLTVASFIFGIVQLVN